MKKLKEILTGVPESKLGLYVSLNGTNRLVKEKLANLKGYPINECCCSCDCECGCSCEPTCADKKYCGEPYSRLFIRFYSEYEIVNKLKTNVKVQDLFDIHRQLDNSIFTYGIDEIGKDVFVPLYFRETNNVVIPRNQTEPKNNSNLYNFINSLVQKYKMTYPTVLTLNDNTVQLFFVKGGGSNGIEGSIKNSLIEVAALLEELDDMEEVTWSQVLDASIDNVDDIYNFVVTCTVDPDKVKETIKHEDTK